MNDLYNTTYSVEYTGSTVCTCPVEFRYAPALGPVQARPSTLVWLEASVGKGKKKKKPGPPKGTSMLSGATDQINAKCNVQRGSERGGEESD